MTDAQSPGPDPAPSPLVWAAVWFVVGLAVVAVIALVATAVVPYVRGTDGLETFDDEMIVLSGRDDSLGEQRAQLVAAWNEQHPHQRARIVPLSSLADAQRAEMLARAQADHGDVDVYNLDVTLTAEFAASGYLKSLDESVPVDGFLDGPLSTCRYAGQLWALPWNADLGLLYYRNDLLAEIGHRDDPPKDWASLEEDVKAYAAMVRARPGADGDDVAGYVGQLADYEGRTVTALELIWGAGGTVVTDDGDVLPRAGDFTAVRTGLDRLRRLNPALPALNEDTSLQEFHDKHALFMRNWPRAYRSLSPDTNEGTGAEVGVALLPDGSGALGGQNLAVSARSKRPNAARALVEFLTSERSEQLLFERGGLPATRGVVYTDPQVNRVFPFAKDLGAALGNDKAARRPAVRHYARFSEVFRAKVDGYLRGTDPLNEPDLRAALEAALKG